ncbi:MAG TPA: cobalamin-independent methionine synthase II family protein [Nitriliruptorales bacterium]|nr:cobalamin-independent methionine synthase II family protein [Nitriliruptorales bacterium]
MLPTEPIGSIPRPIELMEAVRAHQQGALSSEKLRTHYDRALRDTIESLEATGSPVIVDGEQTKPSFATYPIEGLEVLAPDGITIPFEDGHTRQLPRLTAGPFHYQRYADTYLEQAQRYASVPVKQAVIAPSALSLLYPDEGVDGYPREAFIEDLLDEAETDIRRCLAQGAHIVQLDFTEGRLAVKLDPSHQLLAAFIDLNQRLLARFSDDERSRIGVHTCPGSDQDAAHSLDADYAELLPSLLQLEAASFYIQLASEQDRVRVLGIISQHVRPHQRIFVGVIDPIDPRIETADEVRDRVLEAAEFIPLDQLGTCDDCGFAPFGDDTSTPRETAFAKIRARVEGTRLASDQLGA